MNKRLTVINKFEEPVYCILSDHETFEKQLMEVLNLRQGQGFSININKDFVEVKDYYSDETVGLFKIISFVDTNENADLNWKRLNG